MAKLHLILIAVGALAWAGLILDSCIRRFANREPHRNKAPHFTDVVLACIAAGLTAALRAPLLASEANTSWEFVVDYGLVAIAALLGGVGLFTSLMLWRRPLAVMGYPVAACLLHFVIKQSFHGVNYTFFVASAVVLPALLTTILNRRG
jgi:hypothetical protein